MKQILEKNYSKKSLRLISIAMGIGAVIFYFITESVINSLGNFDFGAIKMFAFIFALFYVAYVIATGVSLYYSYRMYFKENRKDDISIAIIFGVNCWAAFVLLLNIQTILFFFRLSTASSVWDIGGLATSLGGVETAANLLDITFLIFIGMAVYSGVLFNQEKGIVEEPSTATTEAKNTSENQVEKKPNPTVEKVKGFLATKKGKMITGGVAAALVVVLVLVNVISNKKTDVNLMENIKVEYTGISGDGYAVVTNDSFAYDGNNDDVNSFLSTVYFTIDGDNGQLKNGDKITVRAKYSEDLASEYKVNPTKDKKEITVKGLTEEFDGYNDLSKKEKTNIDTAWKEYFEEGAFKKDVESNLKYKFDTKAGITLSDQSLVARYYANSENVGYDKIIYVVKVTAKGKESYGDTEKAMTVYYRIELDKITEEGLEKVKKNRFEIKYGSTLDAETDKEAQEETVDYYEDRYNNFELTLIK